jgi:hypothetical protein
VTLTKAEQIERAFGVPTPAKKLERALTRRDDPNREPYHPVTPYQIGVLRQRVRELGHKGYQGWEACIILLMRGARIEALADAAGYPVEQYVEAMRRRVRRLDPAMREDMEDIAMSHIRLWNHLGPA